MAKEIIWTPSAEKSLKDVVQYLWDNWSEKEVSTFINKLQSIVKQIQIQPLSFRFSGIEDIHEAIVTKQNLLLYRVSDEAIFILLIWDTRRNPLQKLI